MKCLAPTFNLFKHFRYSSLSISIIYTASFVSLQLNNLFYGKENKVIRGGIRFSQTLSLRGLSVPKLFGMRKDAIGLTGTEDRK